MQKIAQKLSVLSSRKDDMNKKNNDTVEGIDRANYRLHARTSQITFYSVALKGTNTPYNVPNTEPKNIAVKPMRNVVDVNVKRVAN